MKVRDADGFLPVNLIQTIDAATPLADVFGKIEGHASGFVLSESGTTQGYVSAQEIVSNLVETGSWRTLEQRAIIDLIRNPAVNLSMIQVAKQSVRQDTDISALRDIADLVVKVEQGGKLSGYLLPEELISEIHTPPHIYMCTNTPSHPNSKPGPRCRICPFPVPE